MTLFQEPKTRFLLIMPPLVQLCVFTFAATLEINNVHLTIFNQDQGRHSQRIIERFVGSKTFTGLHFVSSMPELQKDIDTQTSLVGIHFGQDFSRRINRRSATQLHVILDGRSTNGAQITLGYINRIVNAYNAEINKTFAKPLPIPIVKVRHWFNPNLDFIWFMVPSLMVMISLLISLMVTSLSIAREKELGTFEQLLVSPLPPHEIILGKTVPALIFGILEGLAIFTLGTLLFGVPFHGNFLYLLIVQASFILSSIGVGLFISILAKTQQQAIISAFLFLIPAVTLSGYSAPIENMPLWLQRVTLINPMRYALTAIRGLFLKDLPWEDLAQEVFAMLLIGCVTLFIASRLFAKKLN